MLTDGKVIAVPEQYSLRLLTVTPGSSDLLSVIVQSDQRSVMDDHPDVRNVDAKSKGVGTYHDPLLAVLEILQDFHFVLALTMIARDREAALFEKLIQLFDPLDRVAVNYNAAGFTLTEKGENLLSLTLLNDLGILAATQTLSDLDHAKQNIISGNAHPMDVRSSQGKLNSDFIGSFRGGSRGKCRHHRTLRQTGNEVLDPQIVLAEAASLLDNAMCLVHHNTSNFALSDCLF